MLVDGHLRAETTPDSEVPVLVLDINEAEADLILATLDPLAAMAGRDDSVLTDLLESITASNGDVLHLLEQMQFDLSASSLDAARDSLKKPMNRRTRTLPIDMFITGMMPPYCCIAVTAGMSYGLRSTARVPTCVSLFNGRHDVQFIDNDFHDYDHAFHVNYVKQHRPRYATVRDIMTERQCQDAGIEFYTLAQVLEFADEMRQYADNVIVIPKFDCLYQIPADLVLGYSIPTTYGGTPLPIEAFQGRPVHLLGGSWKQQRNALEILGDDVVSVDNNQIQLLANAGSYYKHDGASGHLSELGIGQLTNPGVVAFALSAGGMAAGLKELMGEEIIKAELESAG